MSFSCSVYGLGVQVNLPIAGLAGLPVPEQVDVRMTLGQMPPEVVNLPASAVQEFYVRDETDENGEPCIRVSRLLGGRYFRVAYSDGTIFVVDAAGTEVWATWPDKATVEDTATYLLGPILGFVLRLRGTVCLHASAVAIGDRAIALVGRSGAGKSSTAAAFASLGHPVLSDDVVALTDQGASFKVQPAYPRVRLWPESVESMFGAADALPRITPTWGKLFLDLNGSDFRFQSESLTLGAIYFLGERSSASGAPSVDALGARESLMALVSDTYATNLLEPVTRAREFELLGRLVRGTPLRQVTPSTDMARISELCAAIVEDFHKLMSPNRD